MISVIIPAYNEAENIKSIIKDTASVLEECGLPHEIIVIDDGSKDNTYGQALSVSKEYNAVKVFRYKDNKGKGYAIKHGFQHSTGDEVLLLDADSDLPPSQVKQMLHYMNQNGSDIILGSKRHPLSEIDFPLSRRILSRSYNMLCKMLFNLNIQDTQTGIKVYKRDVLDRLMPKLTVNRFAFDIELVAHAARLGYIITEVPIALKYHNHSRVNLWEIIRIFLDTMKVYCRTKFLRHYDKD
ncbi:glycosyltransferase [Chloroflexota bacterium]